MAGNRSSATLWLGESVSIHEKSENLSRSVTVQLKVGSPMRVSHSSMGCDADQVAKIGGENRTLVAAEGRLRQ